MLAKIICWGQTREEALMRMQRALEELVIEGVRTTAGFHRKLLSHEQFRLGNFHTRYVQEGFLS